MFNTSSRTADVTTQLTPSLEPSCASLQRIRRSTLRWAVLSRLDVQLRPYNRSAVGIFCTRRLRHRVVRGKPKWRRKGNTKEVRFYFFEKDRGKWVGDAIAGSKWRKIGKRHDDGGKGRKMHKIQEESDKMICLTCMLRSLSQKKFSFC